MRFAWYLLLVPLREALVVRTALTLQYLEQSDQKVGNSDEKIQQLCISLSMSHCILSLKNIGRDRKRCSTYTDFDMRKGTVKPRETTVTVLHTHRASCEAGP